jgi:hypothetical protein
MTSPITPKTLDIAGVILLVLAILSWLLIAVNLSFVVGKSGEGDAAMGKALSTIVTFVFVVLMWLLMAGLLIRAGAQEVLTTWAALAATLLLFLSGAAAIAAVFLLDDPRMAWPAAIPIVVPILIVGYVVCLYQPALTAVMARPQIGGLVWGAVLLIALTPWPAVHRSQEKSARAIAEAEQIGAQQGQVASQKKKEEGLIRIQQMKPDSHIWDWFSLLNRESGVQQEALAAFSTIPNRQADLEEWMGESLVTMEYVASLDIKLTPKLCEAAERWCKKFSREMLPQNRQPSYYEEKQLLEPAMTGLRWFHANGCALDNGIAEIEAGVRKYRDTPHRKQMLQQLRDLHKPAPQ